jgi:hypothetical protein
MPDRYRVTATSLNLRTEPVVRPNTRRALLPNGHPVERLRGEPGNEWWLVTTELDGRSIEGWTASRYLAPAVEFEAPAARREPVAVHLREDDPAVRRNVAGRQAFPLGEAGRPGRGAGNAERRRRELGSIIDWLDVEHSARYQPVGGTTYCNIYAYDYCYLSGVYLPRVWWTSRALQRMGRGEAVAPRYAETVSELNANMLLGWFVDYGPDFGWRRTFDPGELQDAANEGGIGIICARRTNDNQPGHIAAVAPESDEHQAARSGGAVVRPLQSQAGTRCFCYGTPPRAWWADSKFREFGFWVHD